MSQEITTISEKQAKDQGYKPLTRAYRMPVEQDMLDNVLRDMRRGNIPTVLVPAAIDHCKQLGLEVWRMPAKPQPITAKP